jgi:2-polyprenyl-6-methoxyphenol hydroxylase-like FAD-dependent oxidoreductase
MSARAETGKPRVVIVGAGPVGVATAIELGHHGVPCVVIERNTRAGYAPRAKTTHTRTREHLRRWGIAERLAEAAPFGIDYPPNVVFVTRLAGPEIARFEGALYCSPRRDERYSEHSQWIPQYKLEAVLQAHARTLPGVSIEFGQQFLSFEQDERGVRVHVRDVAHGAERIIEAEYLVGADGSRSAVRESIGAKMVGTHGLSRNYNTIFQAPGLAEAHAHGPAIMYWQCNSELPSLIGPMDSDDLWFFMPMQLPPGVTYSPAQAVERIRVATGIDLPYKILSSDEWVASKLLADRYRNGRAFLVGDACHLHPPFGGFGMNMGIADGVDIGWKLAAVLHGWGGERLLESYEIERRAAHEFVLEESESNHAQLPGQLAREGIEELTARGEQVRREVAEIVLRTKHREFFALGVMLGYSYRGSPVIVDDGQPSRWHRALEYVPMAEPGCLAPHRWLSEKSSLYDLFGEGFTLLAFADVDAADLDLAVRQAHEAGVPLQVVRLADASLRDLYQAKRALIRPDQHIAWRGDVWPESDVLGIVCGRARTRRFAGADSRGLPVR